MKKILAISIICFMIFIFWRHSSPQVSLDKPLTENFTLKEQSNLKILAMEKIDKNQTSENKDIPIGKEKNIYTKDLKDIGVKIAAKEFLLKKDDVINKLNSNAINEDERRELGKQIEEITRARMKEIEMELASINEEIAQREKAHIVHLEKYGIKR